MKRALFALIITIPTLVGAQGLRVPGTLVEINQNKLLTDIVGTPVLANTNYNIEGSPYFPSEYCNATIKVIKGKKYQDVSAKVNLQSNEVYVKFSDGIEFIATVPLEYVEFNGCNDDKKIIFRSGFPVIEKQTGATYYQVLSEGDIALLKNFNTTFRDYTPYGGASVTRSFESSPLYYAYSREKGIVRLKDNAALLQLIPAQKSQLEKFMNDEGIKIKKESDLLKLFGFVNSIAGKAN